MFNELIGCFTVENGRRKQPMLGWNVRCLGQSGRCIGCFGGRKRPMYKFSGDFGRFRLFHLSHKLCTMKIYNTSAVFCKNIGCFSPTSATLTQTSAAFVRTSATLTLTSAALAQHRPLSATSAALTSAAFAFRHRPLSTILVFNNKQTTKMVTVFTKRYQR